MSTNEKAASAGQGQKAATGTTNHSGSRPLWERGAVADEGRERSEPPQPQPSPPPMGTDPGPVTPGSDLQNRGSEHVSGGLLALDWVSITAPDDVFPDRVRAIMGEVDGGPTIDAKARQGFKRAVEWSSGVQLSEGHSSGRAWLQAPGAACAALGGAVLHRLGQVGMSYGGKCKRLDIRLDRHGVGQTLIWDLIAACERRELRRVRHYLPYVERVALTRELISHGVDLGSRSSTRFVRAYDKGLEQRGHEPGDWLRVEAQLRDGYAHEAAAAIFTATAEAWPVVAFRRLVGVADFRIGTGPHLERLPQPAFWREFCDGVQGVRAQLEPVDSSVDRWTAAARAQYGGVLRLAAERAGVSLADAAEQIFGGSFISKGTRNNPIVDKLAAVLRDSVESSI